MPWLGNGTFARIYSWVAQANAGIDIIASQMDTDTDDITGNGFNNTLTRDGQGSATANLPMNSFVHTGVGPATAQNQYATAGQIQTNGLAFAVGAGTADAITATFSPAIPTLTDGMQLTVRAPGANTSATPQFSPNGLTAYTIKKNGGNALSANDYTSGKPILLEYVLSGTYWELLNPNIQISAPTITLTGAVTGSGTTSIATSLAAGSVGGSILSNSNAANAGSNALGNVTISTSSPSGSPSVGDRWIQYIP